MAYKSNSKFIYRFFSNFNKLSKSKHNNVNLVKSEFISASHPVSNMRFRQHKIRLDETFEEKQYRLMDENLQRWNHDFWNINNKMFLEGKSNFKENIVFAGDKQHELLSKYYKEFLNNNYERQKKYNREWYKRNIGLLIPAYKAHMSRLIINVKQLLDKILVKA